MPNNLKKAPNSVELSARESLRLSAENSQLNAFLHIDEQSVIQQAMAADQRRMKDESMGILDGVLIAVKDNIHVAGMPNTAGTSALRDYIPQEDAPVIKRLKEAGGIIFGKTNMHELAFGISSYNSAFFEGHVGVRNAFDSERMAGGSSGGTGAAIGAGIVSAGLGTDTGGSVRIPAALNGIVGFRPTVGRYSGDGVTPISHTRDTVGPLAANVEMVALLDAVMAGEMVSAETPQPTSIQLGIPKQFLHNMEPEVGALWHVAIAKIEAAGITLIEVDAAEIIALNEVTGSPIAFYEAGRDLRAYLEKYGVGCTLEEVIDGIASPDVAEAYVGVMAGELSSVEAVYREAMAVFRPKLIHSYETLFATNQLDALIFPTTPAVAKLANQEASNRENFTLFTQNTGPGSAAGLPGLSIPMGMTPQGLPAGLEIDGLANSDSKLLALGAVLEQILS